MRPTRLVLWLTTPLVLAMGISVLIRNLRLGHTMNGQPVSGATHRPIPRPRRHHSGRWQWPAGRVRAQVGQYWRFLLDARSFLVERHVSDEQEWMDLPGRDPRELAGTFRDLRRVNRWLGGDWLTIGGLERLISGFLTRQDIQIIDVASGPADIPRVISDWTRRRQLTSIVVATDINPAILGLAKALGSPGSLELVTADARGLPFADRSFDIATCSLVLHHLDAEDVVYTLREMRRVAREGVVINDLVRGWPSYLGALVLSRIATRNPISRHDAPLSARRAYTQDELRALAARAGLELVASQSFFGYRLMMVARPV